MILEAVDFALKFEEISLFYINRRTPKYFERFHKLLEILHERRSIYYDSKGGRVFLRHQDIFIDRTHKLEWGVFLRPFMEGPRVCVM